MLEEVSQPATSMSVCPVDCSAAYHRLDEIYGVNIRPPNPPTPYLGSQMKLTGHCLPNLLCLSMGEGTKTRN